MNFLEERIKKDGQVRAGNILKVDSFLNHQLDTELLDQIGQVFYEKYKDKGVTRILTVEASGIAIACAASRYFKVPWSLRRKPKAGIWTGICSLPPFILLLTEKTIT